MWILSVNFSNKMSLDEDKVFRVYRLESSQMHAIDGGPLSQQISELYFKNLNVLCVKDQGNEVTCQSEVAALTFAHVQQRDGRWCIVDLVGKHGRIESLLTSTATTSLDNFSFWSALDSEFLGELVKLAYWKNLYYISPYPIQFLFAYLDYNTTTGMTPDQINAQETPVLTAALQQGILSATGQAYSAAIKSASAATTVSAASGFTAVAPGSIVSIYGSNLATTGTSATSVPLPVTLGGVSVSITDSSNVQAALPLFYTGPQQINAQIPGSASTGLALLSISAPSGNISSAVTLVPVAPGLFSANGNGEGAAAAQVVTNNVDGSQSTGLVYQCPGRRGNVRSGSNRPRRRVGPIRSGALWHWHSQPQFPFGRDLEHRQPDAGARLRKTCAKLCRTGPGQRGTPAHADRKRHPELERFRGGDRIQHFND